MFALLGLWRAPLAKSLQLMSWGYIDQTHTETVSKVLIAHHGLEFTWMGLRDVLISRRSLMSNFKKRLTEAKFQFFEEVKDSGWTINDFTLLHYFSICVEYWCYRYYVSIWNHNSSYPNINMLHQNESVYYAILTCCSKIGCNNTENAHQVAKNPHANHFNHS